MKRQPESPHSSISPSPSKRQREEESSPSRSPSARRPRVEPESPNYAYQTPDQPVRPQIVHSVSGSPFIVNNISAIHSRIKASPLFEVGKMLRQLRQFAQDTQLLVREWSHWKLQYFQHQYHTYTEHCKENYADLNDVQGAINMSITEYSQQRLITLKGKFDRFANHAATSCRNIVNRFAESEGIPANIAVPVNTAQALLRQMHLQLCIVHSGVVNITHRSHCLDAEDGRDFTEILLRSPSSLIRIQAKLSQLIDEYVTLLQAHQQDGDQENKKIDFLQSIRQIKNRLNKISPPQAFIDEVRATTLSIKTKLDNNLYSSNNIDARIAQQDLRQLGALIGKVENLKSQLNHQLGETDSFISADLGGLTDTSEVTFSFNGIR